MVKQQKKKKSHLTSILVIFLVIALLSTTASAAVLPPARSAEVNHNVFLGGDYLEVGVSSLGSFGTMVAAPAGEGFHPISGYGGAIGLMVDGDGWDIGEDIVTGDFFLPGSPEERFILGYKIDDVVYNNNAAAQQGTDWNDPITPLSTVDESNPASGLLKAKTTGVTAENVKLVQTVSFNKANKYFTVTVDITNHSENTISDVRYVRSFDPDMDSDLHPEDSNYDYWAYGTYGRVVSNPRPDGTGQQTAMVVARGEVTLSPFFFISYDPRARASCYISFSPSNAYLPGLWVESDTSVPTTVLEENYALTQADVDGGKLNGYVLDDSGIAITFALGNLAPGQSTSLVYYSSLDPNVSTAIEEIVNEEDSDPEPAKTSSNNFTHHEIVTIMSNPMDDSGIRTSNLNYYLGTPAIWNPEVKNITVWLETEVFDLEKARQTTQLPTGITLLKDYNIRLMMKVLYRNGTSETFEVDNADIKRNIPVLIPVDEFAAYTDLGIVYIDTEGKTAILPVTPVSIDGKDYLQFENNHFSQYGVVTGEPAAGTAMTHGSSYIIQPGDTLSRIATHFNVTVGSLVKANKIANPDLIITGKSIIIA